MLFTKKELGVNRALLACLMLLGGIALSFWSLHFLLPAEKLPIYGVVTEMSFVDQDEKAFGVEQLRGRLTVLNFFFSRCTAICPTASRDLSRVAKAIGASPKLQLVSITVDPENDTPEKLRQYAANLNAKPGRWHFLRAPQNETYNFAREQLMIGIGKGPETHTDRVVLIDEDAQIRGYYKSTDPDSLAELELVLNRISLRS